MLDSRMGDSNVGPSGGTQIDPVCGMTVQPETAAGSSEHGGRTYYFCSAACKTRFDADPGAYTGKPAEQARSRDQAPEE